MSIIFIGTKICTQSWSGFKLFTTFFLATCVYRGEAYVGTSPAPLRWRGYQGRCHRGGGWHGLPMTEKGGGQSRCHVPTTPVKNKWQTPNVCQLYYILDQMWRKNVWKSLKKSCLASWDYLLPNKYVGNHIKTPKLLIRGLKRARSDALGIH